MVLNGSRGQKEVWPERQEIEETPESKDKLKKAVVSTVNMSDAASIENVTDVHKYSSRERLLRLTAWAQRFANNCIISVTETARITGSLSVEEIWSAEKLWLQTVHSGLRERATFSQLVSQLGLVENEGVLYCKGRRGLQTYL